MTSLHEAALDYATIWGWPVFPITPGEKTPACPHGYLEATTDVSQINDWWKREPAYNIGLSPDPAGLCVLDLDRYKLGFVEPAGLPPTWVNASPRGGEHHIFKGRLPSRVNKLGTGIDTRGSGGYILLPPSRTADGVYRIRSSRPFAPIPAHIVEALGTVERERPQPDPNLVLDAPADILRAKEYLKRAPIAVSGAGGNNHTFQIACKVLDLGLSVDAATIAAAEAWNGRCDPPWSDSDLTQLFSNAWRFRHNQGVAPLAVGSAAEKFAGHAAASGSATEGLATPAELTPFKANNTSAMVQDCGALDDHNSGDNAGKASTRTLRPLTIAEVRARAALEKDPEYLWQGRLLRDEPNLWTGDGGLGKTTIVENVAVAVASGTGLLGKPTVQAPVLLVVAEDRYKPVLRNLDQIAAARGLNLDDLPITVFSLDSEEVDGKLAHVTDEGEIYVTKFFTDVLVPALAASPGCLLVLDPLAEFVHFDHNNDKAARAAIRTFFVQLARRYHITPLFTDHVSRAGLASGEGYGGSREMKGAPALLAHFRFTDPRDKGYGSARRALTMEVIKNRYGPTSETNFYRLADTPALKLDMADGMTPAKIDELVLAHICQRVDAGLTIGKTNAKYGPDKAAEALEISTHNFNRSIERLSENGLIDYQVSPGHRHPPTWTRGPKFGAEIQNE